MSEFSDRYWKLSVEFSEFQETVNKLLKDSVPRSDLRKLVERWRGLRYSDTGSEYENGISRCANELESLLT